MLLLTRMNINRNWKGWVPGFGSSSVFARAVQARFPVLVHHTCFLFVDALAVFVGIYVFMFVRRMSLLGNDMLLFDDSSSVLCVHACEKQRKTTTRMYDFLTPLKKPSKMRKVGARAMQS